MMKRLLLFAAVVAALVLVAVAIVMSQSGPPPPPREQAEDDIREAVFRYQLSDIGRRPWDSTVNFLALGGSSDPDKEFMKRFAGHVPWVKPYSECRADPLKPHKGVFDVETGRRGRIFHVNTITWVNNRRVEVEGGYYSQPKSASINVFTVKWKRGKWVVVRDEEIIRS